LRSLKKTSAFANTKNNFDSLDKQTRANREKTLLLNPVAPK